MRLGSLLSVVCVDERQSFYEEQLREQEDELL